MKNYRYSLYSALTVLALSCFTVAQGQTITTVAGGGTGFTTTGPATAATLVTPYGIVQDGSGNLFITEEGMGTFVPGAIQELAAATLSNVAGGGFGAGGFGGDGGLATATATKLSTPFDVAVDAAGDIFIADEGNSRVRMINTAGIISTIAGSGLTTAVASPFGDGGPATATGVRLSPHGIVCNPSGSTIYVSDAFTSTGMGMPVTNNRVRVLTGTPAGGYTINTYVGTGTSGVAPYGDGGAATAANVNQPRGLFLDASGNLYIADMGATTAGGNHSRIRKVDAATGIISTVAGAGTPGFAGDGGLATAAGCELDLPTDVAVDAAGNIYIADAGNSRIRYVAVATGLISTIAGGGSATLPSPYGDGGAPTAAYLDNPVSIALDLANPGNYYITDQTHNRIRYVSQSAVANVAPTFVNGATQSLIMCEGATASLNTDLAITDPDVGQTETWSLVTTGFMPGPAHGTVVGAYTTTSTGLTLTPTGLTYTPNPGFTGTDFFTIQETDGTATITTRINVTVNPTPTVAAIAGPSSSVCVGLTIALTDATTGGVWMALNANAGVAGGTVTGAAGGTDNIYYIVSNACGADTATRIVTVNPDATPSVSVSSSLGTVTCSVPGVFTALPVSGGPSPTYLWSVNGVVTGITTPTYTYTPLPGDVVSVQLTSDAPCASPLVVSNSITMSSGTAVAPTISISSGIGDTMCVGIPVTFTSTITNGGLFPTFSWTVNGAALGTGSTFVYVPSPTSDGDIIECMLTSSIACVTTPTAVSNVVTVHIRSAVSSTLHITASPGNTACAGTHITYTATYTGGGSTPSLRWTRAGINVATGPTYTTVPNNGDAVYCTMHSSIACSPSDSVLSNVITMNMVPATLPVSTIIASGTIAGINEDVTFNVLVDSGTVSPGFQWYVNGVAVPGATSATFIFSDSLGGTDAVNCSVTSGDACHTIGSSNVLSLIVSAGAGVKQVAAPASGMNLVPNPNKGVFTMTLSSGYNEPVSVVITNILGEEVKQLTAATNKTVNIKLDQVPGIYFLTATTGHGSYEAKVIIN